MLTRHMKSFKISILIKAAIMKVLIWTSLNIFMFKVVNAPLECFIIWPHVLDIIWNLIYRSQIKIKTTISPLQQLQDGYINNNSSSGSQQCVSQPATPGGALPVPSPLSPSPASLSSYHGDDSDSISSPPWPLKAPSSPVSRTGSWLCVWLHSLTEIPELHVIFLHVT